MVLKRAGVRFIRRHAFITPLLFSWAQREESEMKNNYLKRGALKVTVPATLLGCVEHQILSGTATDEQATTYPVCFVAFSNVIGPCPGFEAQADAAESINEENADLAASHSVRINLFGKVISDEVGQTCNGEEKSGVCGNPYSIYEAMGIRHPGSTLFEDESADTVYNPAEDGLGYL